jgi:glycosyltransferase involved in cell wall biosynthesis
MKFSIIIPARNEEKWIGSCIESIERASKPYSGGVEIIVVLNRCTDSTERIALAHGVRIVRDESKCLAKIRNTGARWASGDILVTIDADSVMSENMLIKIDEALASGKIIGGGVPVKPDRMSPGIFLSMTLLWISLWATGLAGGVYWCHRRDFEAVGGFNEMMRVAEDLEFAKRLGEYGKKQNRRFVNLWGTHIVTSSRKFDKFGDWLMIRMLIHPRKIRSVLRGEDRSFADTYFYDFEH